MINKILIAIIITGSFAGCHAPPLKTPERVATSAVSADTKLVLEKTRNALHSLISAKTKAKMAVEIHIRGQACRVAITGELKTAEANAIGVATLNVLSMYFLDFLVTINERVFRLADGMRPEDGTV